MANEACFIRQRSLLHLASKPTSFFYAKNRACGLTICDCGLTILVDHFKLYL